MIRRLSAETYLLWGPDACGGERMRDVSWWRVLLAFVATMAVLYALAFALNSAATSAIPWIVVFTVVANVV